MQGFQGRIGTGEVVAANAMQDATKRKLADRIKNGTLAAAIGAPSVAVGGGIAVFCWLVNSCRPPLLVLYGEWLWQPTLTGGIIGAALGALTAFAIAAIGKG